MSESNQNRTIRPIVKVLIVILVLGGGMAVMQGLMETPVKATSEERTLFVPRVEVYSAKEESHKVVLGAQGMVEPVTQTMLVSEVAGAIEWISPKLKAGGRFTKGEEMLRVSAADYQSQLEQARASVADAELTIAQEEARAEQGLRDWKKLGRGGEPGTLVKREPQLKSARARLVASQAAVVQAERNLSKTKIVAPYDCLVESSNVDAGGYLSPAGRVAMVYEADKVQVRLPLSLEDVSYLPSELVGVEVQLSAKIGRVQRQWQGAVVRTEGVVDRSTHTMMTVVEIQQKQDANMFQLPPFGLFVEGVFQGANFENVVRLPRVALRAEDTVWLVNQDGQLKITPVVVERGDRDTVMVVEGLKDGDAVITSPIDVPVELMKVEVIHSSNKEM